MEAIAPYLLELGAGAIFSIAILVVVLKYLPRKSSNGMTTMHYLETVVVPKIDKLQSDHNDLTITVATLPTRDEFSEFKKLIRKINEGV